MIDARTLKKTEQIYTWVRDDGINFNVATSRLLAWINDRGRTKVLKQLLPVTRDMVNKFIAEGAVSPERIKQLVEGPPALDPIILCLTGRYDINGVPGPEAMLVDGRHRYTIHALLGLPQVAAYIVRPQHWARFQIAGLMPLTKEEHARVPVFNHLVMPHLK